MTQTSPVVPTEGHGHPARSTGLNRRAVVAGVGGVACIGALTACGGGSTATAPGTAAPAAPDAPSAGAAAPSAAPGTAAASGPLASVSDIPVGGGAVFADRDVVVVQPTAGEFKAYSATCTHQGCKVNAVADGAIVCPCHNSRFAVADGSVQGGPARQPLPEKSVTVDGDSIVLA